MKKAKISEKEKPIQKSPLVFTKKNAEWGKICNAVENFVNSWKNSLFILQKNKNYFIILKKVKIEEVIENRNSVFQEQIKELGTAVMRKREHLKPIIIANSSHVKNKAFREMLEFADTVPFVFCPNSEPQMIEILRNFK